MESTISLQEEDNVVYSPVKQAILSPSNLDLSRITTHEQERCEFMLENTLSSPLALQNNFNKTFDFSTKTPQNNQNNDEDEIVYERNNLDSSTERSALDFSILPQSNQICNNDDEIVDEENVLFESIGHKLAKLICEKDSKKSLPLLSVICDVTSRSKAEMILGRTIGRREWGKARRHAIFPGAGEPVEQNFWKHH